uniref:Uncharacterized protein n=1 Tax=Avena sativa TaxID=4498 RepID=A0ACD5XIT4_AVESA
MASLLLKGVHKRLGLPSINISCSSADATSVVSSTSPRGGSSRVIDRHSPRLRDPHRTSTSSKPPRPSFGSGGGDTKDDSSASSPNSNLQHGHGSKKKKKSGTGQAAGNGRRSSEKRLVSPATSSRFLLNSSRMQSDDLAVDILELPPPPPPPSFIDVLPGKDAALPAWPVHFPDEKPSSMQLAESSSSSGSSSASSSSEITPVASSNKDGHDQEEVLKKSSSTRRTQAGQVVVLRVSLHCKGCAGKVKKHIAKMEGVTSFDIDIPTKKVTVVGDVTPLGVLNTVSKVRPAQFWPDPPAPGAFPPRASASF